MTRQPRKTALSCRPAAQPLNFEDFSHKVEQADLVVVVNPNNPTGSSLDSKRILQLADQFREKTFFIDESFIEFSEQIPMQQLLAEQPLANVVVLRSLSKSLGVPGLRLGYAYCYDLEFNTWLNAQLPVWNLNSVAEHFLEIILKHRKSLADSIETTKTDRAQFILALRQTDYLEKVADSQGNFIMVSMADKILAGETVEYLLTHENIFVKDVSAKYAAQRGFLRFAVRTPVENARLVDALRHMPRK